MLKAKGRWRRWLGIKGKIWYYTDEIPKESTLKLYLPSFVAITSVVVSGVLSHEALVLTRRTYASQHQPRLKIKSIIITGSPGANKYAVKVENVGSGKAHIDSMTIQGLDDARITFCKRDVSVGEEVMCLAETHQIIREAFTWGAKGFLYFSDEFKDPAPSQFFCLEMTNKLEPGSDGTFAAASVDTCPEYKESTKP